jgi:hypothetical protein
MPKEKVVVKRSGGCTSTIGMAVVIVVGLIVLGAVVGSLAGRNSNSTSTSALATATKAVAGGNAPAPTIVRPDAPTDVPPTEVPPTPVPPTAVPTEVPLAPPIAEIAANKKKMTDAQWDAYAETLKGRAVKGLSGKVQSVDTKVFSDDYRMIVDLPDPVPGYAFDLYVDVAKADALNINKDASVAVSGTIKLVSCVLTYCPLELENATYTIK